MTTKQASYKIDNAQDLYEMLSQFSETERETMAIKDYDCLDLELETLSDKSEVLNLRGRWQTADQEAFPRYSFTRPTLAEANALAKHLEANGWLVLRGPYSTGYAWVVDAKRKPEVSRG
jgi:hypothetical protein